MKFSRAHIYVLGLMMAVAPMLMACPPEEDDNDEVSGDESVVISGQLHDLNGQPVGGLTVALLGEDSQTELTSVAGEFEFSDVEGPYDLAVVVEDSAVVYLGLEREDPTLWLPESRSEENEALLMGTVVEGAPATSVDVETRVAWASEEATEFAVAMSQGDDSLEFSLPLAWYGADAITGSLYALEWENDLDGIPETYTGYGALDDVDISEGGQFDELDIELAEVDEAELAGVVSVPNDYELDWLLLGALYNGLGFLPIVVDMAVAYNYLTPDIDGVELGILAEAEGPGGEFSRATVTGLAADSDEGDIELVAGPELHAPENAAEGIAPGTEFSWNSEHDLFLLSAGEPSHELLIITDERAVSLPDLSDIGIGFDADTEYDWMVVGASPFDGVDGAATEHFIASMGALLPGPANAAIDGQLSISQNRSFVTAE